MKNSISYPPPHALSATGYLPASNGNGHRHSNGGNGNGGNGHNQGGDDWNCSPKQKALILRIVEENNLEKTKIEALAQERFGKAVKALNKLEASGLIEELLETTGQSKGNGGRGRFQTPPQKAVGR